MSSKAMNALFPVARPVGPEYMGPRTFWMVMGAAFALHAIGVYAWHLMPKTPVVDIPVRALNIKLGDLDAPVEEVKLVRPGDTAAESVLFKSKATEEAAKVRAKSVVDSMDKAMNAIENDAASKIFDKALTTPANDASQIVENSASKLSNIAKQFVRTNPTQANIKSRAGGKSSAKDAEMMSRYEQLISLWIEKFKQYPNEARAQGLQGSALIRIRIDRQGNIRYFIPERSTGYPLLDRAAIDMVRRANPVPAVPYDYPAGELFEFLIPVNFHLE